MIRALTALVAHVKAVWDDLTDPLFSTKRTFVEKKALANGLELLIVSEEWVSARREGVSRKIVRGYEIRLVKERETIFVGDGLPPSHLYL